MRNTDEIWTVVDNHREAFERLSDAVFDTPETNFNEVRSAAAHAAMLHEQGFRVTENVAGIATAVIGEAGEGGPVIAILGEFDALPELSQEAGEAAHTPVAGGGAGHGCGHNLLGAGAMLAATAVKDYLAAHKLPGRVRYYGCPAEEGGAGKTFMVRDGAFADVDIAITWHPMPFPGVNPAESLANVMVDFTFRGRASHAAAAPELGRSALDAVELMSVGINYMREHMRSSARIHYAYQDAGGVAPNVVQATARVRTMIRAERLPEVLALEQRVRRIAEGAALMTETKVSARNVAGMSNLIGNRPLEEALHANITRLGPPEWTAEDRAFAERIRVTISPEDVAAHYNHVGFPVRDDEPLPTRIVPLGQKGQIMKGSTDVGDVSWVVPLVQADGATVALGTPFHSWQMTAQGKSAHAKTGMVHVAKAMAATALDALQKPELVAAAKAELAARTAGQSYTCPIPADVQAPRPAVRAA
ncbi:MAG: amidohydrolase [Acetobacteraceae bacterium]|nr:amidohydrolase [Acetobacteraceae bacterium]